MQYQKSKATSHSWQRKLVLILTEEDLFVEIAIDVIREFPQSEGHNTNLVATDWFTQVQHYIKAKTTCTATDIANSYINNIWRLYGLQRHNTLDTSPQCAFKFIRELNCKFNINLSLATYYYAQKDRLSTQVVQTLKQDLGIYSQDWKNHWLVWLLLAEFANNTTGTTTYKLCNCRSPSGLDPLSNIVITTMNTYPLPHKNVLTE